MIARCFIALPYEVVVPRSATLPPLEFDHGPYHVKVYAPQQGQIDPQLRFFKLASLPTRLTVPWREIASRIRPADPPIVFGGFTIDGDAAVQANLLQIDFQKEEFERRQSLGPTGVEPTIDLIFDIANGFLAQLRALIRAGFIRSVQPGGTFWRVDYLTDEGAMLTLVPGLSRSRFGVPFLHELCAITEESWAEIRTRSPVGAMHLWDELITEATALLVHDIRLAIVVACAALESFIAWCLDRAAENVGVKPELWHWINHRQDWQQEPSTTESFGSLLKVLLGCSLTEAPTLWKAYGDLRKARNKFVHEGRPYLLSNTGNEKPVTEQVATELVNQAAQIIDWVEAQLPPELQRPRLQTAATVQWIGPPEPLVVEEPGDPEGTPETPT